MLFKKIKCLLLLAVVFIFSTRVHADLVIIPTSDSDFPNEIVSLQGLDLELRYNDVVIHTDLLGSTAAETDKEGAEL
tara:strand:- start:187 stop:417 length:231 start_codon:yes stop_codon:yes gene_type:complete